MKNFIKKTIAFKLLTFFVLTINAQTLLLESFENFNSLFTTGGWYRQNNSIPLGDFGWEDGTGLSVATPHSGKGYVRAWFQNTDSIGNISNWLMTPALSLQNGDTVEFWTSALFNDQLANRLECRLSKMGGSNNVGTSDTSVGDFTTLLVSVNPNLLKGLSNYPPDMTRYFGVVSGLSGPTNCKVAFRYWITNGGNWGTNGTYIGLDDVQIFRGSTSATDKKNKDGFTLNIFPNPAQNNIIVQSDNKLIGEVFSVYDNTGRVVLTGQLNAQNTKVELGNLTSGIYLFSVGENMKQTLKLIKE